MSAPLRRIAGAAGEMIKAGFLKAAAGSTLPPKGAAGEMIKAGFLKAATFSSPKAVLTSFKSYGTSTVPTPIPKLSVEVSGKLLSPAAAGSTKMYQMTVCAETDEQALESVREFVGLVRSNDTVKLAVFCSSHKVTLTEIKASIGMAADEILSQASEYNTDLRAEFDVFKATVLAGQQQVKEELKLVKGDAIATKDAIERLETAAQKFTVLKFLGYLSAVSLVECLVSWRTNMHVYGKMLPTPTPPSESLLQNLPSA